MKLTDLLPDIESIEFKVTSEKSVSTVRPSLDENIEAVYEDDAPECKYFNNFTIEMYATDDMNVIADLGFLKGTSIESALTYMDYCSFLHLSDMVSSDIYHLAVAVTDEDGHIKHSVCPPDRNIMYIENVYIEEPYCGLGVDISKKIKLHEWEKLPWRWVVERTLSWLGHSRRLAKDFEISTDSAETMVRISHLHTLLKRC